MNECEKFWLRINKKHLIADCCAMAVFTVFGGGWLIAVIFYVYAVEFCGMNYLFVLRFSGNDGDALNLIKTLPLERRMFYNTYIKMMILQSTVFAAVYAIGTAIGKFSGFAFTSLSKLFFENETFSSMIGCYAFLLCLVILAVVVMAGLVNRCSTVKRAMLIIGTCYCSLIFQTLYTLYLTLTRLSKQPDSVHRIFAATGGVALCVMVVVLVMAVKRNRAKFVTK
jgi:hypothetical protein